MVSINEQNVGRPLTGSWKEEEAAAKEKEKSMTEIVSRMDIKVLSARTT